jgi:hypothetical protein
LPVGRIVDRWESEAKPEDPTDDLTYEWDTKPGRHEVRIRATDEGGNVQPNEVWWNDLGYLYNGVIGHLIDVL